jgi:FtsZ-binding cell division protein ZapB
MNNASYKQHIKSRTHKDFIENYKKYYKEVDEAQQTITDLKAEIELLKRKNTNLKVQNNKLLEIIEEMNDEGEFEDCL